MERIEQHELLQGPEAVVDVDSRKLRVKEAVLWQGCWVVFFIKAENTTSKFALTLALARLLPASGEAHGFVNRPAEVVEGSALG